jgi:hypothetical protein
LVRALTTVERLRKKTIAPGRRKSDVVRAATARCPTVRRRSAGDSRRAKLRRTNATTIAEASRPKYAATENDRPNAAPAAAARPTVGRSRSRTRVKSRRTKTQPCKKAE